MPVLFFNYDDNNRFIIASTSPAHSNSTIGLLSALYGIILFILGLAFPLAQVISSRIPPLYYEVCGLT